MEGPMEYFTDEAGCEMGFHTIQEKRLDVEGDARWTATTKILNKSGYYNIQQVLDAQAYIICNLRVEYDNSI
jgi:hypothetical protein